jgi:hypothetical protein
MEPEGLIPNSQDLSTCPYPEPAQSSPHHPMPPLQDPSTHLSLGLPSGLLPSGVPPLPRISQHNPCTKWNFRQDVTRGGSADGEPEGRLGRLETPLGEPRVLAGIQQDATHTVAYTGNCIRALTSFRPAQKFA